MIRTVTIFAVFAFAVGFTSCWTIRPIDSKESASDTTSTLNPAEYVTSLWSSKLLPAIESSAVDARTFLDAYLKSPAEALARFGRHDENGPAYLAIKGEGRVISVDTTSKVGLALVDVTPFDGKPDVTIQVGPVLRGTSLRDATRLIRFSDFVNQLQYADVGNELNERVLKTVLAPLEPAALGGKKISFAGTARGEVNSAPPIRELMPIRLTVQESR
jgi:predicted lipoprotein